MKKKIMEQVIMFYVQPDNFDDTEKFKIARIINSNWNWGIVCEKCFKKVKSVSRCWFGLFVCKNCRNLGD